MAERLADLFVEAGITRIVAEAVCKELLPKGDDFEILLVEDFKTSPDFWVDKVKNELALFSAIGAFTCDERFIDYLTRTKLHLFINDVYLLIALYGDTYELITRVFRNSFKHLVLSDMKAWAPRLMNWDNYWTQDEDIGKVLLDEERSINRKEPVLDIPWLSSPEDYDEKVLFPALRALLLPSELQKFFMMKSGLFEFRDRFGRPQDGELEKRFSKTDRRAFVELVDRLGVVSHWNRKSIYISLMNGCHGNPGFLDYLDRRANESETSSITSCVTAQIYQCLPGNSLASGPVLPHGNSESDKQLPGCFLTVAFEARRMRAESLVGDFKIKVSDPGEFEVLSKLFAEVNC